MMGSAPPDGLPRQKPNFLQTRVLQPGDQLNVMIEVNGPGGFYAELARTICFGDPPVELLNVWKVAVEAQVRTAERLRPGAKVEFGEEGGGPAVAAPAASERGPAGSAADTGR